MLKYPVVAFVHNQVSGKFSRIVCTDFKFPDPPFATEPPNDPVGIVVVNMNGNLVGNVLGNGSIGRKFINVNNAVVRLYRRRFLEVHFGDGLSLPHTEAPRTHFFGFEVSKLMIICSPRNPH